MTHFPTPTSGPVLGYPGRLIRNFGAFWQVAVLCIFCAAPAWGAPIIFNLPTTSLPGNIVGLSGSGFGTSPKVYFRPFTMSAPISVKIIRADNNFVAFQVPKNLAFDVYYIAISDGSVWSRTVGINYPQAMQFDKPEIAPNDSFRIFGRNLYVAPVSASVILADVYTGEWLTAAVDLTKSDPYSLTVTAPAGVLPGHTYRARVTSGSNWTYTSLCLIGHAANGDDHFQLGVPWGRDYVYKNGPSYNGSIDNADHHVFDVTSDPFVTPHAKGDGITDDLPAIQAAVKLAAKHGGVVYLPAGTYRFASLSGWALTLASNVVVQGHGANDTTILFGPATQQPASYVFWGFVWPAGTTMSGLADLSIKNVDKLSQSVRNLVTTGATSKVFIQRVNWDLNTGYFLSVNTADRFVIANSNFHQAINNQLPDSAHPGESGTGPLWFEKLTNFMFQNNTVWWASAGNAFLTINGGVFEGNHFTRSASDKVVVTATNLPWYNHEPIYAPIKIGDLVTRQMGRQIAVEFAKNVVIQKNTFDVTDGEFGNNSNDGETINSEGGAAYGPQQDVGIVTTAGAATVTANSKCVGTCNWNYKSASNFNAGSKIAIVTGQGAGQWRQITQLANNTFTVSTPWDIVPSPGDHFTIFVPSMENTLIRTNVMQDNPRGILLYSAGFYNVSVVNNLLKDSGGIWLNTIQDTNAKDFASPKFGALRNIEINGNTLITTKGLHPSNIVAAAGMLDPNYIWGTAMDAIEVRNNSITGKPGTPRYDYYDGTYSNDMLYADPDGPFSPNGAPFSILGTIFQGNTCNSCPIFYYVGTGVSDTIIWNSSANGVAGVTPSVHNTTFGTSPGALGTVVGHD